MKICTNCVISELYPGVHFDGKGVCNFCRADKSKIEQQKGRQKYEKQFLVLLERIKGRHSYDCLVAYSGGKDSTYTLYQLKNKYKLSILALTYDNWFQSEQAARNIRAVVKHLHVDHLTFSPNYDVFKKIVRAAASKDIYSVKALERASSICTTCISLIRFMCFRLAIEKEIPLVIFGMSPGQAPMVTSVVKMNPGMVRKMQDIVYKPLFKHLGDSIRPLFLEESHFRKTESFPYSVNPLAFSEYREDEILDIVKGLGWVKPKDTDPNSTNCLLNALANHLHFEKYGFNPYTYEMAGLVRQGHLGRAAALERLAQSEPPETIHHLKKLLELP